MANWGRGPGRSCEGGTDAPGNCRRASGWDTPAGVTFADFRSAVGLAAERGQLFIDDHEWSLEESPLHPLADCSFRNRAVQMGGVSELLI